MVIHACMHIYNRKSIGMEMSRYNLNYRAGEKKSNTHR
jgi:hypothetical protein